MKISFCNTMVFIALQLTSATNTAQTQRGDTETVTISGPEGLKGEKRVIVDGMATQGDCDIMLDLAQIGVRPTDAGPFTYSNYEKFEGLDVTQVAKLAQQGVVPVDYPDKFLTLSGKSRRFVHDYFGLEQELFFEYTHLVCRTAVPVSAGEEARMDLSHPVHADNCQLSSEDLSCGPYQLEYDLHQRHYSAVLFLNDDFEGGEFFFAHRDKTAQTVVQPKCGRLVAFSSGAENPHGVQAVLQGRRCVLAMWYTLDKQYEELPRYEARELVDSLLKTGEHRSNEKLRNEL